MNPHSLPLRAEVNPETTWDVASVFATPAHWDAAVDALFARIPELQALKGTLGRSATALAAAFDAVEKFRIDVMQAVMYATIEQTVDTGDQERAARAGRARTLAAMARSAVAFVDPELMEVGFDTLRAWIASAPRLAHYGHYVDQLERLAPHVRSSEVEEILGMADDPFSTASATHGVLTNSEMPFAPARGSTGEEFEVAQGTLGGLITDPDREVRCTAW